MAGGGLNGRPEKKPDVGVLFLPMSSFRNCEFIFYDCVHRCAIRGGFFRLLPCWIGFTGLMGRN